jgi:prolyl 4-hydroxylase
MNSQFNYITTEDYQHPNFSLIKKYRNVFTATECQQIIEYGRSKLEGSKVGTSDGAVFDSLRRSRQAWLKSKELPCLGKASLFVSEETKLPIWNQEDWQLLHYDTGGEYQGHYDTCNPLIVGYNDCVAENESRGWGARVYTFFIYLNDVPAGGETRFNKLGLSFKPEQGSALLWRNTKEDSSECHDYSMHAGMPVIKGEKWAINVWVRERPERIQPPTQPARDYDIIV